MPTIEQHAVALVPERISEVAAVLRRSDVPKDSEDVKLSGFSQDDASNFWLIVVAICHQTSPMGVPPLTGVIDGRWMKGWDYLVPRFKQLVDLNPKWLDPHFWCDCTEEWISNAFGPDLTDPAGRAELVRDLGKTMRRCHWASLRDLYDICGGRIEQGHPNLLCLLKEFEAYSDPVFKKSYFLLALLRNSCGWVYHDIENLGSPVDYHEVRGHLRIGTVMITDPALSRAVENGEKVSQGEDVLIRTAVRDAIFAISHEAGINDASIAHYMFWNVFRSHCQRKDPNCNGTRPSTLPERYRLMNAEARNNCCPFSSVCQAFQGNHIRLMEYTCDTNFY